MRSNYKEQQVLQKAAIAKNENQNKTKTCTEQRRLLIRCLSTAWEKWIATSLAGQDNMYTSFLWTWARIEPIRLKPIPGYFFRICLKACPGSRDKELHFQS